MNTASTNQESAMTTEELAQAVIHELQRRNDPATTSATWPGVVRAIKTNPRPFAHALGLLPVESRKGRRVH
jgi:hypothetical protein